METVLWEVGVVRCALLVRKQSSVFVHQALCNWWTFAWGQGSDGTYSTQRDGGVLEKGLHNRSKVLSAVIATAVHHFFSLNLMGSDCKESLKAQTPWRLTKTASQIIFFFHKRGHEFARNSLDVTNPDLGWTRGGIYNLCLLVSNHQGWGIKLYWSHITLSFIPICWPAYPDWSVLFHSVPGSCPQVI